ncbi:MAG: OmpA family protein, partial [Bacteroidota bacterium]
MDISRNTMVLLCILLSLPGYAQYRVQIAAYGEAVPFNYFELLGLQEVDLSKDHNDIFRYYLPEQHTLEDAEQLQSEAMEKGFQYAQIIDLAAHRKRCANLCSPAPLPPLDDRKYKQMINFGFGGYQLSAFAKSELDVVSHILRERPEFTVRLMGHTDAIGSAGYNISLASRRVMESKHYLMGRGIGADRLKVKV